MNSRLDLQHPAEESALKQRTREAAFDAIVFQTLRPAAIGLTGLYVFFGFAHLFMLNGPAKKPMMTIAFCSAVGLAGFWTFLRSSIPHVRHANPLVSVLAAVVLGNSLAHMYFTGFVKDTTNLMLVTIGIGCVYLSTIWAGILWAAVWIGWAAVVGIVSHALPFLDFGLTSATALALIIHVARRRTCEHLEELRVRDISRKEILEQALNAAEREIQERQRIEADLHVARNQLELRVAQRTAELATANEALRNEVLEREKIAMALRKSEASLVLAQKIGHVGSWELDLKTEAVVWSAEACRIFGYVPGSVTPTRDLFLEAVHPEDRSAVVRALKDAIKAKRRHYNIDHRIVLEGGVERMVCEQAELLLDSEGEPVRLVGTVQDITERKQLEAQLRHSQKMEAIGQLAAGIAHDFNNVLTVIIGHANLLQDTSLTDAERNEVVNQITEASERAASLTRQLLVFSTKQPIQSYTISLNDLTSSMTAMLSRFLGENITLSVRQAPNLSLTEADPTMIEQIVVNLVMNARDAMPKGGHVILSTSFALLDLAHTERNPEARPGGFVRLSVADNGAGMKPEVLARIFEPFFTTKPVGRGTGLGLSIVYGLVKQHNGWIEVSSEVGKGTQFDVYFPAAKDAAPLNEEPPPLLMAQGGNETILVVEDEAQVRLMACRFLRRQGYEVLEADSAISAKVVWEEHRAKIDLLLTDLMMPGGMSGRELAEKCLETKPDLKVIYTSGYSADFEDLGTSLGPGICFLPKPYPLAALTKLMRECLD